MKTAFPYRYIPELPTFKYGCLMGLNFKMGIRQNQGELMSNHCLICHCWYDVEELTVSGSSNSKAYHISFVLKIWKKNLLHFVSLNEKQRKKQISLKSSEGGWLFCGKFRSFLSKLIFPHLASCWSHRHGVVQTWNNRLPPETERTSCLTNCQTI